MNFKFFSFYENIFIFNGDWGLGIGDWGLGIGPKPQNTKPKTKKTMKLFYQIYK